MTTTEQRIADLFRRTQALQQETYIAWAALAEAVPDDHAVLVRLPSGKLRMILFKMQDQQGNQQLSFSGPQSVDGMPWVEITVPEPRDERIAGEWTVEDRGLAAAIGKWPGTETDEQVEEALRRLS